MVAQVSHLVVIVTVFPRTKKMRESSMKKIVLISIRSTTQPKMVNPLVFDCTYVTASRKFTIYGNTQVQVDM